MALIYHYSNVQIALPAHFTHEAVDALNAAFPELPKLEGGQPAWATWYFSSEHAGVVLNVKAFNQSQVGDIRQKAFEVLRKLVPGLTTKEVRHEVGELYVPGSC